MKIDLHVHTKYSGDCNLEPKEIINSEKKMGIDCVAITDHNRFEAFDDFKNSGIKIIKGEEISTNKGHLIGLFIEEKIKTKDFIEACDEIKSQGGLSILPHPFRSHRDPEKLSKYVDVIEIFNSRTSEKSNNKACDLADKNRLPKICGSDAHFNYELGNGTIEVDEENLEHLKGKIIKGKVKFNCTMSPFYVHPMTWIVKGSKIINYLVKR